MDKREILELLAGGKLSIDDASKLLGDSAPGGQLRCKVSEKRAVSVYGLQRMPLTLYAKSWLRLLDFADQVRGFIEEHRGELSWEKKPGANGKKEGK
jgi:hypothetical protein